MNTKRITFLIFCMALLLASCKKDAGLDPLSNVIFPKNGVIRVECTECLLNYTVLKDNYSVDIKNSEDITFSYLSDFELKTIINSNKKQNIRLAVFDSYGRMVSNHLTSFNEGDNKAETFKINFN